jgi:hypothetical protein
LISSPLPFVVVHPPPGKRPSPATPIIASVQKLPEVYCPISCVNPSVERYEVFKITPADGGGGGVGPGGGGVGVGAGGGGAGGGVAPKTVMVLEVTQPSTPESKSTFHQTVPSKEVSVEIVVPKAPWDCSPSIEAPLQPEERTLTEMVV